MLGSSCRCIESTGHPSCIAQSRTQSSIHLGEEVVDTNLARRLWGWFRTTHEAGASTRPDYYCCAVESLFSLAHHKTVLRSSYGQDPLPSSHICRSSVESIHSNLSSQWDFRSTSCLNNPSRLQTETAKDGGCLLCQQSSQVAHSRCHRLKKENHVRFIRKNG